MQIGRRAKRTCQALSRYGLAPSQHLLDEQVGPVPARLRRLALRNGGRYARAVTNIPYQDFVLRSLRSGRVVG